MATIYFVDGEKGGVGKSFVAKTMIQYRLDRQLPFVAVETDRSNPDVAGVYKNLCQYAVFTEDERQGDRADRIFEFALEKPVIVSLAAQVSRAMNTWIEQNKLIELANEHDVKLCKWFVCSGGYDSVYLFCQALRKHETRIPHILVRNFGKCDDWGAVEEDQEVQKLIKKYKVKVIDFPKLGYREGYIIDQERLRFDEAREYKKFPIMGRQRVVNFLKAAYAAFDEVGV